MARTVSSIRRRISGSRRMTGTKPMTAMSDIGNSGRNPSPSIASPPTPAKGDSAEPVPQGAHEVGAQMVAGMFSGDQIDPQRRRRDRARPAHSSLRSRGVQMARSPPWRMNRTMSMTAACSAKSSASRCTRSVRVPSDPNSIR